MLGQFLDSDGIFSELVKHDFRNKGSFETKDDLKQRMILLSRLLIIMEKIA